MHKIHFNNHEYEGPARWEELTAKDLLHFARITHKLSYSSMVKNLLVMYLMDIPYKEIKRLKEVHLIQLHVCIDWLFERNTLSNWLIKTVKIGKTMLVGPADKLSNITGEEFMYTEMAYESWLTDQYNENLDIIFAVLYQKRHWFTRKRRSFNIENLNESIQANVLVKEHVKVAVAINYAGCRNLIIKNHPHIWKKALDVKNNLQGKRSVTSWASIFLQLAGDKFGTHEQTIKTKVWLLLADLDVKAKQAKEMEDKLK